MDDNRKNKQLQIRKESLKKRMPLVILIIIFFLIYNFIIPLEILKWGSLLVLLIYLGIGFYYRKKLHNVSDDKPYEIIEDKEE